MQIVNDQHPLKDDIAKLLSGYQLQTWTIFHPVSLKSRDFVGTLVFIVAPFVFAGASSTPKKSPYHRHLPSQATRV